MDSKHKDIQELFVCRCHDVQHQFIIRTVDFDKYPEVYLSVFLYPYGFFKRLVYGIKYIFGYQCRYGAFDEFIFNPEDAHKLRKVYDYLIGEKEKEICKAIKEISDYAKGNYENKDKTQVES